MFCKNKINKFLQRDILPISIQPKYQNLRNLIFVKINSLQLFLESSEWQFWWIIGKILFTLLTLVTVLGVQNLYTFRRQHFSTCIKISETIFNMKRLLLCQKALLLERFSYKLSVWYRMCHFIIV